jgi:hypothetical protein
VEVRAKPKGFRMAGLSRSDEVRMAGHTLATTAPLARGMRRTSQASPTTRSPEELSHSQWLGSSPVSMGSPLSNHGRAGAAVDAERP